MIYKKKVLEKDSLQSSVYDRLQSGELVTVPIGMTRMRFLRIISDLQAKYGIRVRSVFNYGFMKI